VFCGVVYFVVADKVVVFSSNFACDVSRAALMDTPTIWYSCCAPRHGTPTCAVYGSVFYVWNRNYTLLLSERKQH
jgi:hypothetical protein